MSVAQLVRTRPETAAVAVPGGGGGQRSLVTRNAVALMFSTVATSVLGMVFWTVAARLTPASALGRASAEAAAVTLLAGLAQLNLANVMPRFLPIAGRGTGRFIARGYAAAAGVGLLLSLGYAFSGLGRAFLPATPTQIGLFCAAVILLGILIVQDGVLAALRHATWVPVVKAGFAVAKVGLLPVLAVWGIGMRSGSGVFLAWCAPVVVVVTVVTVLIFARLVPRHVRAGGDTSTLPGRREIASFLSAQYVSSILFNIAYGVPPVLVATVLGTRSSAFFAIPWLIGTSVIALLANVSMSFVAEVSNDSGRLHTHLRRAMRLNALVAGGGGLGLVVAAPLVLMVFGSEYLTEGTTTLRLLGLGLPFAGVTFLYTALNAIDKRVWRSVTAQTVIAILFIGGALLGMRHYGTAGVAVAFDVAEALVALAVLPQLVKTFWTRPDGVRVPTMAPLGRGGFRGVDVFVASDAMLMTFSFPAGLYASTAARSHTVAPEPGPAGEVSTAATVALTLPRQQSALTIPLPRAPIDVAPDHGGLTVVLPRTPIDVAPEPDGLTVALPRAPVDVAPEPGGLTVALPRTPVDDPTVEAPVAGSPPAGAVAGPIPPEAVVIVTLPGDAATTAIPAAPPHPETAPELETEPVPPRGRLARLLLSRPVPDRVARRLAVTGLALGVLTPLLVRLPVGVLPKVVLVLLFALVGPGAAVLSQVRLGDAVTSWAMAFLLSVSLFALVSVAMVWSRLWYPYLGLLLLAVPTVVLSAHALAPALARRPPRPARPTPRQLDPAPEADETTLLPAPPMAAGESSAHLASRLRDIQRTLEAAAATGTLRLEDRPEKDPHRRSAAEAESVRQTRWHPVRLSMEFGPLVAAIALWVYSLRHSRIAGVGDYGLLSVMHPSFVGAVVLVCGGFVIQLARRGWRGWVLVAYLLTALVMLRATVPLLVHAPEYAWTYKHIAVVEFIRATGSVVDPNDIYQQWPTFFAACAVLLKLTGLDALRLGAWAPLVNNLMYVLPLFAIARTLSTNRRVPYLTVFLFVICDWVAQDYFSPQAFVYGLCLGVMLILLRWLRRVPGPADRFTPRFLLGRWAWLSRDLRDVPYASKRAVRVALATLYLLYVVIATAHQLSPYLVAMCAGALVVLGLVSPRQLIPVLLGIAVLYLLPRHSFAETYGIFDGFNIFRNAQGTSIDWGSQGQAFSALVVRVLSLVIWSLALLTVILRRQRLGPVAAPAILAFAPFVLLVTQSYGGEAIYRVFLFSVPWCAYLIATLVLSFRHIPRAVGAAFGAVLLSLAMLAGIQGSHGQLNVDLFTDAELQASGYLYQFAQPGAAIVLATSDFPSPYTANYGGFKPGGNGIAELMKGADLAHLKLNSDDLPAIEQYARDQEGSTAYLVISRSMKVYAHYFGYLVDGALDTLDRSVAASPRWRLFYRNADVVIYQLTAPAD